MTDANRQWDNVWITGASSGIGYELARLMGDKARHIAASARSADKLDALAANVAQVTAYPVDVTDANAVAEVVAAIESNNGPIDLAVLNAGVWKRMTVDAFDLKTMRDCLEVNYMGAVNALDALIPNMLKRRRGHIAIVASVAGYRGLPGASTYGPTKAALINLAETLNTELAPRGITVSVVNPGFVDTPMTKVNRFPMPHLISVETAARKLLHGLEKKHYEIIFPKLFVWQLKALRRAPNWLYFWIVRNFISGSRS